MGGLLSDEELLEGLRHMMTLRAFDARMLMAQRQGKTSFYMQHMGEEAVSCAFRKALLPGDMNFPTYRQAGLLIAAGHSLVDMMCQIYSNEQRPAERPADAGALFVEGGRLLLDFRKSGDAIHPGRRLGDGVGNQDTTRRSPPDGSAMARRPNRTFTPPWSSPPPTRRRWCSTSSTISGRSRPSRASRAAAPARSPRAVSASAFPRSASTATTISPSMPSRNGRSSGRAAISARRSIEYVTYRVGAHSTSDDPSAYRPKTESDAWPLGDPGDPAEESSDRSRAPGRRSATSRRKPKFWTWSWRRRRRPKAMARCTPAASPRCATCSRASTRRCRPICAGSANRQEF